MVFKCPLKYCGPKTKCADEVNHQHIIELSNYRINPEALFRAICAQEHSSFADTLLQNLRSGFQTHADLYLQESSDQQSRSLSSPSVDLLFRGWQPRSTPS